MEEQKQTMQNIQNKEEDKSVDIRTMESDLKSIESNEPPKPYNPQLEKSEDISQSSSTPPPSENSINLENLDFGGGGDKSTISNVNAGGDNITPNSSPQKKNKSLIIGIIVFVVIVGLAALGYFVIYPLISPPSKVNNLENQNITQELPTPNPNIPLSEKNVLENSDVIPPEEDFEAVSVKTSSEITTTTTKTEQTTEELRKHKSPFVKVDSTVTSSDILTGKDISSLSLPTTTTSSLVEVVFTSSKISFPAIIQTLLGVDLKQSGLSEAFDEDYTTGFIYIDKNGTKRIGYVAKLKTNSNLVDEKTSLGRIIESSTNLKNMFSEDPGNLEGWKNGSGIVSPHRYTLFSKSGYSIDYGWKENTFIISSSFEGFGVAVSNLK